MHLKDLSLEIVECNKCMRLREWAESRKGQNSDFVDFDYWARPVPGFGDERARLIVVGLAPGAHGANRTGRPFTGDFAGDLLFRALYKFGFSNQCISEDRDDGLELRDAFITNAVRCVPPDDKPEPKEIHLCRRYLRNEIKLLTNKKLILTLGEKAFDQVKAVFKDLGADTIGLKFEHGKRYVFGDEFPTVLASYHTSKRNFCTNRMTIAKLERIFEQIEQELNGSD